VTNGNLKNCLHGRFVETRERLSGTDGFKLSHSKPLLFFGLVIGVTTLVKTPQTVSQYAFERDVNFIIVVFLELLFQINDQEVILDVQFYILDVDRLGRRARNVFDSDLIVGNVKLFSVQSDVVRGFMASYLEIVIGL
jgi:hypothetical protein